MDQIANVIIWVIVIQGVFLGFTYIFSKKSKSNANKILGFFLLAFVFEALSSDFFPYNYIGSYLIGDYFGIPEVKLFFPVLFLHYVLEKLDRVSTYKIYLKVNYFLAILIFCLTPLNIIFHLASSTSIRYVFGVELTNTLFMTSQYGAFLLTVTAFVISILETYRYRTIVQNEFTDFAMLQINWLWQFILILLPIIVLWGFELAYVLSGGTGPSDYLSVTWIFIFIFLYFFSFKAFKNPNLFEHVPLYTLKEKEGRDDGKENHPCTEDNSARIISAMENRQLYLNEELTLHTFAKEINMSSRLISSCINKNMGVNFNEWVNHFRVEKAVELIKSDVKNTLSIEGIGSDSGFKSRSAMYAAFKKKLGHSPGHYRKI
ncbi:AraC family transcriptional regulator [Algoriphagus sp. SE2]|uniref:helix-turn-helix domain-containing protein n=1 Tax=Algoriphagus sp. SE2 TaxID=3141536 RepID=UPI0031CD930B